MYKRQASTESCRSTFSKENGYNLSFVDCDNKSADQLEAVRNFVEQEVDYIIIDPIVETGWDTVLKEAKDAGIPVLVIDRNIKVDESLYTAWVGSDFTAEGESAGAWLKAYLEAKKKTCLLYTSQVLSVLQYVLLHFCLQQLLYRGR